MLPEPKRRKNDEPQTICNEQLSGSITKAAVASSDALMENIFHIKRKERDFAVAQAQMDKCLGNYRIIDSHYGNYLVPVVPTTADVAQ